MADASASQPPRVPLAARAARLLRALRLAWGASHGLTGGWIALLAIQGLAPVAIVYLTRELVDALAGAVGSGVSWETLQPLLVYGGAMGAVLVFSEGTRVAAEWIRAAQSEHIQDHISKLVQDKSVALDLAFFDMPEFHDHLYRARADASTRPLALLESAGGLLQNSITMLAMAAVILPYGLWLPPALLLSTLPAFYVAVRNNRLLHNWWVSRTNDRRRVQYFDHLLTDGIFAPEVRLFKLVDHFQVAFQALRQRLRGERLNQLRKQMVARLASEALALIVAGAVFVWVIRQALIGLMTLGDLALLYQAFQRGQGVIRSLFGNLGQIHANSLFIGNLFEFLELKPTVLDPEQPAPLPARLSHGITFRDVTFRYPGNERVVLSRFNLSIPAGKIVAIVGANGAGKSTMFKLICRFYDPEEGRVELDGIDLRRLSLDELRGRITLMFQMSAHYQATVLENITLGSIHSNPDMKSVESAAHSAGADDVVERLPKKYNNLLGKWFAEGAELSAGEWQRIALARAFLRRAEIIMLDEPTSMMDSWSEADWFERLRTLASGRTTILITHRLSIAMRADLIHVMMQGEVVESGSHAELLAAGGYYADSWHTQTHTESETGGARSGA